MTIQPLAIDLFCGLGGWTDGLLALGYCVIGFDIEEHVYGDQRYMGELVIQDVLTLHGSQFKDAALIVASPPCQEYSYMAMPWSKAKAKAAAIRADTTGAELERVVSKRAPWGHVSRHCVRCGGVGPRIVWIRGYIHFRCLTPAEKRDRRREGFGA